MKPAEAEKILGLTGLYNAAAVKAAHRQAVLFNHPDTISHLDVTPVWTIDQIGQARDTLLNRCNVSEFACKTCKGKGTVRYRMGTRPCVPCKGTGETHGS